MALHTFALLFLFFLFQRKGKELFLSRSDSLSPKSSSKPDVNKQVCLMHEHTRFAVMAIRCDSRHLLHASVYKAMHQLLPLFQRSSPEGYHMALWSVQCNGTMHFSPLFESICCWPCKVVSCGSLHLCVVMHADGLLSLSGVVLSRKAHLAKS